MASRVRSSGVGPEPACADDEVGAIEGGRERVADDLKAIGDGGQATHGHPAVGQGAGELPGVRVARLAHGQFRPDAEEFCGEDPADRRVGWHPCSVPPL